MRYAHFLPLYRIQACVQLAGGDSMMNKIPTPVAVMVVLVAILVLGFVIFRATRNPAASGDVSAVASEVRNANPKNAPSMPPGINPTAGAMGVRKGGQ